MTESESALLCVVIGFVIGWLFVISWLLFFLWENRK